MTARTVDFLRPRGTPLAGRCLLAAGLLSLVAAAWLNQRWDSERAGHEALLRRQEEAQRHAAEAARRPHVPTVDERRLKHLLPQLSQPWLPTLRTIEGATESPVFLLGLGIDPASGRIQLEGEASSFDQALAYVERLSREDTLTDVHLVSHDTPATAPGGAMRFTVNARWRLP